MKIQEKKRLTTGIKTEEIEAHEILSGILYSEIGEMLIFPVDSLSFMFESFI